MTVPSTTSGSSGLTEPLAYRYDITVRSGLVSTYTVEVDRQSLLLRRPELAPTPPWTRLDVERCPHCPLANTKTTHCPVAQNMAYVMREGSDVPPSETIDVSVATPERTITARTTAQKAFSSLFGLIMATSACPHTQFFRPMARFHLPLANVEETTFRAVGAYLMTQFLRDDTQRVDIDGLRQIYENLKIVNKHLGRRLQAVEQRDAPASAVVLLDVMSQALAFSIESSLAQLRALFSGVDAPHN